VARARIVLGLGNPGAEYDGTRHNVGFLVADALASRLGRSFHAKGRALVASGALGETSYVLAKPTTFMNNSGRAARDLLDEAGGPSAADLLVTCDDFHLPLGRLRCRASGSDGGQKGLASVIATLPGTDVPRVRLGIGAPHEGMRAEDWVLGRFRRAEQPEVDAMVLRATDALEGWLRSGDLARLIAVCNAGPPPA
jgi:peptidyl-tRNA hydrolase, PTH1 family